MVPTSQFFAKLRKVALTLETETTKLQSAFETRNNADDSNESESRARGMRAYHELNCEVLNIKGQVQDHVAQQKTNMDEVSRFIKDCEVKQQQLSEDLNVIKAHWEKYGYQPPKNATDHNSDRSSKEEAVTEDEKWLSEDVEGCQDETEEEKLSPEKPEAPPIDPMRTPQLSDFGLSEVQLKRALAGGTWCAEVPEMPHLILPLPVLNTPAPPAMALTPKRALRMEEEEMPTPQMHDFGISEHTMCFNNDFTMDLRQKNFEKTKKQHQILLEPPVNPLIESMQADDDLESPEPPVFCTPGLKLKNTHATTESSSDLESPSCASILLSTPEVPTFQTPYINRLLSTKKSERKPEPIKMDSDDDSKDIPTHDGAVASKRSWEDNVPHLTVEDMANEMPEMPNLESNMGNSLLTRSAKLQRKVCSHEKPIVSALDLDGPTQEFNLGTPCVRRDYEEPTTPEMPDLSSVTQDICKLMSQAQMRKSANVVKKSYEKENTSPTGRFDTMLPISEQEFHSLPDYLRHMTLSSLNQAVNNINSYIAKCKGNKMDFHIEELKEMINFGAKTRLFIVCLIELKRLDQIRGTRNNSVYKLKPHC